MVLFNCLPITFLFLTLLTFLLFPLLTFLFLTLLTFLLFPLLALVFLALPAQELLPAFSFLAVDLFNSLGRSPLIPDLPIILISSLRVFEHIKRSGDPLQLFLITRIRKFPAQTAVCPDYFRAAGRGLDS